jgi:hypothetical protein
LPFTEQFPKACVGLEAAGRLPHWFREKVWFTADDALRAPLVGRHG